MAPNRFEGERTDAAPLGKPLKFEFSGKTASNRFLKAAMTERLSSWDPQDLPKRGVPSKELVNVYRRWGEGQFGVILTGNVMVDYDQLEAAGNPIVPRDAEFSGERFDAFKELATESKKHGSLIVAQVSHPGRQVDENINPHPISASDVQLEGNVMGMTFGKPRAMEKKDFEEVIGGFAHAAEFLYKAGYDGVELHGAHGYLLAQFLSPSTNKRTDQYGGSLLNRSRLIFEISDAIRERVPDKSFIISIKLNSVEFQEGGFSTDDCKDLCVELEKHNFDFVELSGGTYQSLAFGHKRESTKKREAFFLDFADSIVPQLKKTKAYVTGGLRSVEAMVQALNSVHGVGLARPITHEFDLPAKILAGKVQGALHYKLDEQDFGATNVAAGTQIRLVGKDRQPLDLTQDKYLQVFQKSMEQWGKEMGDNKNNSKYGYVDILGTELKPYGTPFPRYEQLGYNCIVIHTHGLGIAHGQTAGLVEQLPTASDVFTTTIGNVPAGAEIKVEVTYLGELKHDAQIDGVRLTIPTIIAPRYGSYPGKLITSHTQSNGGIKITVDAEVLTGCHIVFLQSPSHPLAVTLGRTSIAPDAEPSFQKASATLSLGTAELEKDFILQMKATNTGNPVAILETHPTIRNQRALMATLVPMFQLPAEKPEIAFLYDRSGSMDSKMNKLKLALCLFVKSLSVGFRHSFLWDRSQTYDHSSVEEAMNRIDTFSANYDL
ncbi:hypothetical protein AB5N19_08740 [Seiridium cardinale]